MVQYSSASSPYGPALTDISVEIISAYVSHNAVSASDVPALIKAVHNAVTNLNAVASAPVEVTAAQQPSVPVRKSITPDFLICLEDGMKFKSLKRHLALLGLTPDAYRQKWKLPPDYPMVAPNYKAARSKIALATGLGKK